MLSVESNDILFIVSEVRCQSRSFSDSLKSNNSEENYLGSGDDGDVIDDANDDDDDDLCEFVTVNISGKRYETRWSTLKGKRR